MTRHASMLLMSSTVKFSSKIEKTVLEDLRKYSEESGKKISAIVTQAVAEYLERSRIRPTFMEAANSVIAEHDELLERLTR